MIQEIALIAVKPGEETAFEEGVAQAAPLFQRARGCRGLALQWGIEHPDLYRLVIAWDSLEDHTIHFRQSEDHQRWRSLVGHCFAAPPQVEHVETVRVAF